jgi:MFS family permease
VPEPAKAPRVNPWWVLAGACTGLFVLMLDSIVVVLALPGIHDGLGASLDGLQWVSAVALALGPLVGGALIEAASWRWIFFINVPVALLGSVILRRGTGCSAGPYCWRRPEPCSSRCSRTRARR